MNNDKVRPIPQDIIDKVRDKANIAEVLRALGVDLQRDGHQGEWRAYSPFRQDKHMGSFKVSESKNICTDFATGESWDAIDAVMQIERKTFNDAVRMLAAMVNVYIDDTPTPKVEKIRPREKVVELPTLLYADVMDRVKPYREHVEECNLVKWLRSLPLDQKKVSWALRAYLVGMANNGRYQGWVIWWNLDELGYLQTGKLMKYRDDGHRDKDVNSTWAHTLWARAGMYDTTKYQAKTGTFGLHLLGMFENAQVCVVESEKTAIICSTFCNPEDRIWIATGGLSALRNKIGRVVAMGREIVIYPDKDGYDKWVEEAKQIGYDRMVVVTPEKQGWKEQDGPKADIADIILRQITTKTTTEGEKVATLLGAPEKAGVIDMLINKLKLIRQ